MWHRRTYASRARPALILVSLSKTKPCQFSSVQLRRSVRAFRRSCRLCDVDSISALLVDIAVSICLLFCLFVTVTGRHSPRGPRCRTFQLFLLGLLVAESRHLLQLNGLILDAPDDRRVGVLQGRDHASEAGQAEENPYSDRDFVQSAGDLVTTVPVTRFPS